MLLPITKRSRKPSIGSKLNRDRRESKDLDGLQAEQKTLLDRIETLNPDLGSLLRVNPLNGKEVQAPLDKDTVLLAYHTGSEWNGLFVVTQRRHPGVFPRHPRAWSLPCGKSLTRPPWR